MAQVSRFARLALVVPVVAALAVGLTAAPAAATPRTTFTPGAAGAGDPYFPDMGNGGYDVSHYDLRIAFDPSDHSIVATAVVVARATQNLSRFDLDLRGLTVTSVAVDGRPARFARTGEQELVITPAHGLARGRSFAVTVRYHGVPQQIDDDALGTSGWVATADGAVAVNQPFGAATYYPVNDTPRDKATYRQSVTVPSSLQVVGNGEPSPLVRRGGLSTYTWTMSRPMASELSSLAIGNYRIATGTADVAGRRIPSISAVATSLSEDPADAHALNSTTARLLAWESSRFGAYPFDSTGGIIDDAEVYYALETQGRPFYDQADAALDEYTIAHELAHQWYGDSVTPRRWSDIWLNEGFATYAEWLYAERFDGVPVSESFQEAYDGEDDWSGEVADPGRDHIFDDLVYTRGAMTLYALRLEIGEAAFAKVLKGWPAAHRYGNASTRDFIAYVERLTGRDLDAFFRAWVYSPGKPAL